MHDLDRTMGRTNMESFEFQGEEESEFQGEEESGVFHEEELNELATELLSVSNDRELQQFLGDVFKRVGSAVGSFVKSPVGQQLGGMLKDVARQALPVVGSALGNMVVPGVGGMIGGKLASTAGSMFGLELEGLSHEDRDFEVAKQYVRLAADAAQNAAQVAAGVNAAQGAKAALAEAAKKFAPGLIQVVDSQSMGSVPGIAGATGRWVRKGRKIILYGV
ncbi:MAG TPA: hypothetical protein VNO55_25630 [Polyangia bacterium]|nr:hypothetical protein [Polyangia bacterium]